MEVLLLTTLFSIVFAVLFLSLFLRDRQLRDFGGVDREALLPLDDGDEPRAEGRSGELRGRGESRESRPDRHRSTSSPKTVS